MSVCPACAGRGVVQVATPTAVLVDPCTRCGGAGDVCDGPESVCESCDGLGNLYVLQSDEVAECHACGGAGLVPCGEPVVAREHAERAWCATHKPGAPPPPLFATGAPR